MWIGTASGMLIYPLVIDELPPQPVLAWVGG
jgi:hypothetical protein